ncbi:DsbA family protein [Rothia sp. ND6WE1A]|uniref:mycothiol-dependent nitroreductase Rv2466c family protein n=1 Tax=Rothia sp. ND6WE1A TaxID=1848190 RepID=UPI0008323246|nr:DsbA family protein [Rothia sp. ND6WE1A]SIL55521.1 DSBA oxidoreductase [Mycobacteroides abscessus subsp. abscessus]
MSETSKIDFWFDPICPWCWMTSRWIKDVEKVRDVEVQWHPFSLAVLNEGRDLPESYQKHMDEAWGPVRVATAVSERYGQTEVDALYTALGEEIHHRKNNDNKYSDAIEKALAATGLPAELAEFATSGESDERMRTSTKEGLEAAGGDDIGVPLMSINGVTFFGPVMSPAPTGEEAGKVFDGALALASYPGFFELKRPRNVGPIFNTEQ